MKNIWLVLRTSVGCCRLIELEIWKFHPSIQFCSSVLTIHAPSFCCALFFSFLSVVLTLTFPFVSSFSLPRLRFVHIRYLSHFLVKLIQQHISELLGLSAHCSDCVCMTQCFRKITVMVNNLYRIMLITLKGKLYPLHYLSLLLETVYLRALLSALALSLLNWLLFVFYRLRLWPPRSASSTLCVFWPV